MIDRHAKKRLRESLARDGLVETIVVNRRTMYVVGGNQRLETLDKEAGEGVDYLLDVAMIDVSEARERELLVRLNNATSQGEYEWAALEKLLSDTEVKLEPVGLGFDLLDLEVMFPDVKLGQGKSLGGLFDKEEDAAQTDIEKLKEIKKKGKAKGKAADTAEHWCAFVATSSEEVAAFLKAIDLPAGERFHDLRLLAGMLQVDLDKLDY